MLTVGDYGVIRRAHRDGMSIRAIARQFHRSRWKVLDALASPEPRPYTRTREPQAPKLGPFKSVIDEILAGVRRGGHHGHVFERLTNHALNGRDAGEGRRTMHGADEAHALVPVVDGVHDLAHLVHQASGHDLGSCMCAYENDFGGRVVVSSYSPWNRLGRRPKCRQLAAVFDWLARGRMPMRPDAAGRAWPIVRSGPGRTVVVLLNL